MPPKCYRQKDRPKIYFSFCNAVLTQAKIPVLKTRINQRDIFTQEITPVEIGQTVGNVKLLIVACITALTPIIYTSVSSDLIATH